MREALAIVEANRDPIDSFKIAALVYGVQPDWNGITRLSAAQITAVRRALAALVRAGKIADMGRSACYPTSRRSYATLERAAAEDREERRMFGQRFQPSDPIKPRHAPAVAAGSPPERV
jgi:hypothetical protein